QDFPRLGCIEVCVRDTNPGEITSTRKGNPVITKKLNREDARRRDTGMAAIRNIFNATGAEEILHGQFGIGLHLMGGLGMGASAKQGVVSPEFTLYGSQRILAADSSIFPNAPGINPALTIAALSLKAADQILAASEGRKKADMTSKNLNPRSTELLSPTQMKGLLRLGDVVIPGVPARKSASGSLTSGGGALPSFSESGCAAGIDR